MTKFLSIVKITLISFTCFLGACNGDKRTTTNGGSEDQTPDNPSPSHNGGGPTEGKCTKSGDITDFKIECTLIIKSNEMSGEEKSGAYSESIKAKNKILTGQTSGYTKFRISLVLEDGSKHNFDFTGGGGGKPTNDCTISGNHWNFVMKCGNKIKKFEITTSTLSTGGNATKETKFTWKDINNEDIEFRKNSDTEWTGGMQPNSGLKKIKIILVNGSVKEFTYDSPTDSFNP